MLPVLRVLPLVGLLAFAPAAGAAVAWSKADLAGTLKAAKAAKKRVMVDVFATWCGPCHAMDAKVYSRPDVTAAIAKNWVAVRIDGEAGEGPDVVKRYHVVGFPTVLFLEADGTEIDRLLGDATALDFIRTANGFAKGEGTFAKAEEAYFKADLFNAAAAADLATRAAGKGDLDRAQFFVNEIERIAKAYSEIPNANDARLASVVGRGGTESLSRAQLAFLKENLARQKEASNRGRLEALKALRTAEFAYAKYGLLRATKDYAGAVKELRDIQLKHAGTEEADEALYQLGYALSGAGDNDGAKKALDGYLANHVKDKDARAFNAYAWFCFRQGLFLEDGIAAAQKGLALAPKDDGLWDTLAELHFKAGRPVEAIASERKAATLKPADAYYKSQIKKFSGKK